MGSSVRMVWPWMTTSSPLRRARHAAVGREEPQVLLQRGGDEAGVGAQLLVQSRVAREVGKHGADEDGRRHHAGDEQLAHAAQHHLRRRGLAVWPRREQRGGEVFVRVHGLGLALRDDAARDVVEPHAVLLHHLVVDVHDGGDVDLVTSRMVMASSRGRLKNPQTHRPGCGAQSPPRCRSHRYRSAAAVGPRCRGGSGAPAAPSWAWRRSG